MPGKRSWKNFFKSDPKVWWVKIDEEERGPFTKHEMQYIPDLSPYTLVKKTGWRQWLMLYQIQELQDLYNKGIKNEHAESPLADTVLALQLEPGHFFLCLLLAALIILYTLWMLK